jgi:M6 family metalloprotease-like protein
LLPIIAVLTIGETACAEYTYVPVTGHVRGLTILVDFPDEPHAVPVEEASRFLNEEGYDGYGMNGSVRDYYYDVSNGSLEFTNDVIGYYTTKHDKSYYTEAESIKPFIDEVFDWLKNESGYDFSRASTTGEDDLHPAGTIRSVSILYTGASRKILFPRAYRNTNNPYLSVDGVSIGVFTISRLGDVAPEDYSGQTEALMMYSYVHEAGHMIFRWFDVYHNNRNDLMGRFKPGTYARNPPPPNPYFRALRGWETPIDLASPEGSIKLIANSGTTTYRYTNPENELEYFFIEAKAREGRNAELGASDGVLVWLVDGSDVRGISVARHFSKKSGVIGGLRWGNGSKADLRLPYEIVADGAR